MIGCIDPSVRPLLLPYVLSQCGDEQALDFEVHLLTCPACFRDLKQLDRAGSLLRELGTAKPDDAHPQACRSASTGSRSAARDAG